MADALPLNVAQQTASVTGTAATPTVVQAVPVTIVDAPPAVVDVTRLVQLTGILDNGSSDDQTFVLRSAAGKITLAADFAQPLSTGDGQTTNLGDLLTPLLGRVKTVTLTLSPDQPKGTAVLSVPLGENEAADAASKIVKIDNAANPVSLGGAKTGAAFAEGAKIEATLLPKAGRGDGFVLGAAKAGFSGGASLAEEAPTSGWSLGGFAGALDPAVDKATRTLSELARSVAARMQAASPDAAVEDKTQNSIASQGALLSSETAEAPARAAPRDVALRLDRLLPATADWPEGELDPGQIKAFVAGKSPSGHVLLQAGEDAYYVRAEGNLPPGTKMLATLFETEAEPLATLPSPYAKARAAVRDLAEALTSFGPATGGSFLRARFPDPSQQMAGTLLFFLSAMKSGKLDEWIGASALDRLEKAGKRGLADKMAQELSDAVGTAQDSRAGEWKAWPIPIPTSQGYDMARLYVRREGQDGNGQTGAARALQKQTRFIIAMNMSRLGPMQVDGLSRPQQLDLVIRSEKSLPPNLPDELQILYRTTLEALGLVGLLTFQSGRSSWVSLAEDKDAASFYG